jgi:hypothetical protein
MGVTLSPAAFSRVAAKFELCSVSGHQKIVLSHSCHHKCREHDLYLMVMIASSDGVREWTCLVKSCVTTRPYRKSSMPNPHHGARQMLPVNAQGQSAFHFVPVRSWRPVIHYLWRTTVVYLLLALIGIAGLWVFWRRAVVEGQVSDLERMRNELSYPIEELRRKADPEVLAKEKRTAENSIAWCVREIEQYERDLHELRAFAEKLDHLSVTQR